MNDPTQANRLSSKLFNFVCRFGHHSPLTIHSSKSLCGCVRHHLAATTSQNNQRTTFSVQMFRTTSIIIFCINSFSKNSLSSCQSNHYIARTPCFCVSFFFNFILCISILDSNTQSSDIYTLSTNSGSENSKASSSDTSPALRNSGNQSRLSASSRPTSERNSSNNPKCVSEGSASPLGHSSYSATTAGDICADNQTVINLGTFWYHQLSKAIKSILTI